ncbi:MAG: type II toxin-antitoxin system HipA family toxin, partial [Epsilonproteobacteria bacterium]
MQDNLKVNVTDLNVGKLSKEDNKYIFSYNHNNTDFISLTMPSRDEQYLNSNLHPIFEMHLPEGYLLSIIKKHFSKLTKTDDFGMLKIMSSSIKGRITYDVKIDKEIKALNLDELINPSSDNLFNELVSKFALNSSLSGV